jgi:hypothetical protein
MHPQCTHLTGAPARFFAQLLSGPHVVAKAGFSKCPAQVQPRRADGSRTPSSQAAQRGNRLALRRRHPGEVFNSSPVKGPPGSALRLVRVRFGAGLGHLLQKFWILAVFGGYLFTRSGESGQASTDGSDFRRCFYGCHSAARAEKSAARHPMLPKFHKARGALSLPEGAEIVSRAAARRCERPRSLPTRATAPAGPENQGAPTAGRSCTPPGAGRCFWRDRWRRSRGSLADGLAIGGPPGPQGRPSFSEKGSRTLD